MAMPSGKKVRFRLTEDKGAEVVEGVVVKRQKSQGWPHNLWAKITVAYEAGQTGQYKTVDVSPWQLENSQGEETDDEEESSSNLSSQKAQNSMEEQNSAKRPRLEHSIAAQGSEKVDAGRAQQGFPWEGKVESMHEQRWMGPEVSRTAETTPVSTEPRRPIPFFGALGWPSAPSVPLAQPATLYAERPPSASMLLNRWDTANSPSSPMPWNREQDSRQGEMAAPQTRESLFKPQANLAKPDYGIRTSEAASLAASFSGGFMAPLPGLQSQPHHGLRAGAANSAWSIVGNRDPGGASSMSLETLLQNSQAERKDHQRDKVPSLLRLSDSDSHRVLAQPPGEAATLLNTASLQAGPGPPPSASSSERCLLFEKAMTPSDVGKLNRLVIPKHHAERCFPVDLTNNAAAQSLSFEDPSGKVWHFRYSYWSSSQSYVLTKGWSRYVKAAQLQAGDVVTFERGGQNRLFIAHRHKPSEQELNPLPAATWQAPYSADMFTKWVQAWTNQTPQSWLQLRSSSSEVQPAEQPKLFGVVLNKQGEEQGGGMSLMAKMLEAAQKQHATWQPSETAAESRPADRAGPAGPADVAGPAGKDKGKAIKQEEEEEPGDAKPQIVGEVALPEWGPAGLAPLGIGNTPPEMRTSSPDSSAVEQAAAASSRVKCFVEGSPYGVSVDLRQFKSAMALKEALLNATGGAKVVYQDQDGDMVLLGDETWEFFLKAVRKLFVRKS